VFLSSPNKETPLHFWRLHSLQQYARYSEGDLPNSLYIFGWFSDYSCEGPGSYFKYDPTWIHVLLANVVFFYPASYNVVFFFFKDLCITCKYTVAVFRHTRRGHQISLQMVVSHHVVAAIWTLDLRKSNRVLLPTETSHQPIMWYFYARFKHRTHTHILSNQ
jgi:phage shock protein PspC (stress-responsive transcriptional regulator)